MLLFKANQTGAQAGKVPQHPQHLELRRRQMREGELQLTGLRQEIHRLHSPGRAAETSALEDPQKAATLTADRCPDLIAHSLQPPNLSSSSGFKRGNRTPLSALPLKARLLPFGSSRPAEKRKSMRKSQKISHLQQGWSRVHTGEVKSPAMRKYQIGSLKTSSIFDYFDVPAL